MIALRQGLFLILGAATAATTEAAPAEKVEIAATVAIAAIERTAHAAKFDVFIWFRVPFLR